MYQLKIFSKKFYTEFLRPVKQILRLPIFVLNYFFGTFYYDYFLSDSKYVSKGSIPLGSKVVIFLIFPTSGLNNFHIRSLKYFIKKGYSPIIVSNFALSQSDRSILFKYSNVCIERKNFGYDFGGYRDGILGIHKKIKFLERLLLVNDSTWFPLSEGNDWIDFVESSTLDFAGATSHYGLKRAKLSISKANSENYKFSSNRKNFHYASYALGFSKSILRNNEFLNFWKQLRLTGAKNIVVRRGEIGLTQWILKNKEYSHGSLIDSKNIENVLKTYSKKRLIKIARDLIIENKSLEYFKKINFNKLESYDSKNLIHYIMIILSRQIIIFSLAKFLIEDLNFPFLKKMILKLNEDSAIKAYESSQTLNQEISKDIEIEIKNENSLNTFLNLTWIIFKLIKSIKIKISKHKRNSNDL